jgi:hypothetical protein
MTEMFRTERQEFLKAADRFSKWIKHYPPRMILASSGVICMLEMGTIMYLLAGWQWTMLLFLVFGPINYYLGKKLIAESALRLGIMQVSFVAAIVLSLFINVWPKSWG